jgi:hypothetical protein
MPIDKLTSTHGLLAAMRSEVEKRAEKSGKRVPTRSEQTGRAARSHDPAALRAQLAELARPVDPADAAAVKAVRPQFVRAILLWEFGPSLREHPEWRPMLESVTQTLETHPPHQAQFQQLLLSLKR